MTGQLAYYYTLAMSAASFIAGVCDADGNLSRPKALSIDPVSVGDVMVLDVWCLGFRGLGD